MKDKEFKEMQERILRNILSDINKIEGYQRFKYSSYEADNRFYQKIEDREGVIIKHAVILKSEVSDNHDRAQAIMAITSNLFIHYVKGNK